MDNRAVITQPIGFLRRISRLFLCQKVQLINVNSEMKKIDLFFWLKKGALTPW